MALAMVATKRVPLAEVDNGKERRAAGGPTEGGGVGSVDPLGGFIFVCNNDTMGEDFERHLFGKVLNPDALILSLRHSVGHSGLENRSALFSCSTSHS